MATSLTYNTASPLNLATSMVRTPNGMTRNKRSHSNSQRDHRGQAAGHRLNSNSAGKPSEGPKMENDAVVIPGHCVAKDTVPSGSVVNTTESSSDSPRVTHTMEGKKTTNYNGTSARTARKRRRNGTSRTSNSSSGGQSSVQPSKLKHPDGKHDKDWHGTGSTGQRVPAITTLSSALVDSGRGDELSSSCESDHQTQIDKSRNVLAKRSCPQSPVPAAGSHSDVEDEFQDALSNLPSENEQSKSTSTSSSAFVTPLSTRSQSPVLSKAGSSDTGRTDSMPDELAKAVAASLSHMVAEQQENTDSSGIASDISKDTVVGADSARDSSSCDDKSSGCRDNSDGKEPSSGAVVSPRPPALPSSGGSDAGGGGGSSSSSKSGPKKRLNGMQRSKGRRAEQSRSDSAMHREEIGRTREGEAQKKTSSGGRLESSRGGTASMSPTQITKKHPSRNKSRKAAAAGVDYKDKSSHHQHPVAAEQQDRLKKPQPLLLQTAEQVKPSSATVTSTSGLLTPSKGLKTSQLSVEFNSLSSASPASSVCSCSPVTLSPSPTSSLQLHQTILTTESLSASLLVQHQHMAVVDTNLTAATTALPPPPSPLDGDGLVAKGEEEDDSKDEWPDFGMYTSPGDYRDTFQDSGKGSSNAINTDMNESNVPSEFVSNQEGRPSSAKEKPTLPSHSPRSSATVTTSETQSTGNPEAPSSAFKVASSSSETLPSLSEFPSSAFKVLPSHADLPPSNEVPSSAFKVPFIRPEVVLTSAPNPSMGTSEEPIIFEPTVSEPPISNPPVSEPPISEPTVSEPPVSEPTVSEPPISEPPILEPPILKLSPENESSSSEAPASVIAAVSEKEREEVEEEEEHDSGCNMSTCSGGAESATSAVGSVGGGTLAGNQPPELSPNEHAQYPIIPEGPPLNPLCEPVPEQLLSPDQYLQLKRDQLTMFVQQYQEKVEKQTDDQIFFPVEPPPHTSHVTMMISSPPVQILSPPAPIPMMTPTMFLQSPPPPLHHHHPVVQDIRTSLAAGAPPFLTSSPPPPPPPPLPPNLPYNMILPAEMPPLGSNGVVEMASTAPAATTGHSINIEAAEFRPSEEDPVEKTELPLEEVEHPLLDTWVMWFDRIMGTQRNHASNYQASLNEVSSIASIEQFWQVYNHIVSPKDMENNSNLHFFKRGIQPMWEDPANQDGGKWVLTIKNDPERLATCWMEVLLLLVGGGVEKGHLINGAVTSRRKKGDRIALWTSTRDEAANLDICIDLVRAILLAYDVPVEGMEAFMKDLSEGRHGMSLVFMYHSDALLSGHSYQNNAHIKMTDHIEVILKELKHLHSTNPSPAVD